MEKKILESLLKRPGLQDQWDVLTDMIQDSISDMRTMLNYDDEEELPDGCIPAIKELVLVPLQSGWRRRYFQRVTEFRREHNLYGRPAGSGETGGSQVPQTAGVILCQSTEI